MDEKIGFQSCLFSDVDIIETRDGISRIEVVGTTSKTYRKKKNGSG